MEEKQNTLVESFRSELTAKKTELSVVLAQLKDIEDMKPKLEDRKLELERFIQFGENALMAYGGSNGNGSKPDPVKQEPAKTEPKPPLVGYLRQPTLGHPKGEHLWNMACLFTEGMPVTMKQARAFCRERAKGKKPSESAMYQTMSVLTNKGFFTRPFRSRYIRTAMKVLPLNPQAQLPTEEKPNEARRAAVPE